MLIVLFILAPLALVIGAAFTDWQLGRGTPSFVGLANFTTLLSDPDFHRSLGNTARYTAMVVPLTVSLGLLIALLIARSGPAAAVYRAIYFLPVVATLAAMSVVWQLLLSPTVGVVARVFGWLGVSAPNWLQDPALALPIVALVGIWSELGFAMLFFLAGLRTIPTEYYEAAMLDGCGGFWDRLWLVTWPQLVPTTLFVFVITTVHAVRVFDVVAVMTHGGPQQATQVLLFTIYQEAFQLFRTNLAAAATVIFIVIVLALSLVQLRIGRDGRAT
jgi:multiple sugar transport system permease protein